MRKVIIFLCVLAFISFVSAVAAYNNLHLNIQVTYSNGSIQTGTFAFVFNISSSSDCANIVYSNSTTLTTDSRGIISYYLPNVTLDYQNQYWLCYYKSGVLTDTSELARVPYTFQAKNVTLSGVKPDVNFDLTSYNITTTGTGFFSYLGSLLSRITNLFVGSVNATGNIDTGGNVTASNLFGDINWSYVKNVPDFASSGEPLWTANHTAYNLSWSSITNTSYYLATNPSGFFNNISNFTEILTDSKYCTYSLSAGKINCDSTATVSEADPYWTGNYSIFLTHITWANAVNGTLFTTALYNANYSANDALYRSITNTSYYLETNPSGFYNLTNPPPSSGGISGVGSFGYIPMWNGTSSLNTSAIFQLGDNIGIGTSSPATKLHIYGSVPALNLEDSGGGNTVIYMYSSAAGMNNWSMRTGSGGFFIKDDSIATDLFNIENDADIELGRTNVFFIQNSSGNVGIGTSSPLRKLHVRNTGSIASYFEVTAGGYGAISFSGDGGTTNASLTTFAGKTYFGRMNAEGTGSESDIIIDSVGNVGIGTSSPLSILHIDADSAASSVGVIIESNSSKSGSVSPRLGLVDAFSTNPGSSAPAWFIDNYATDFRIFQKPNITTTSESIAFFIESTNNNVGIGTTSPGTRLTLAGGDVISIATPSDDNYLCIAGTDACSSALGAAIILNGISRATNPGNLEFYTGISKGNFSFWTDTEKVRITNAGNVGIGTTSPGERLDIVTDGGQAYSRVALGSTSTSWGGSTAYPTIFNPGTVDQWVMFVNPHISYTQNGVNGFTGSNNGAGIRMASDTAATTYWDMGVGENAVGTDKFSIGRAGTAFLSVSNAARLDVASNAGSGGYISSGNYGGTGTAAYFPNGLWSNGANAWIYGAVTFNGAVGGIATLGVTGVANFGTTAGSTNQYIGINYGTDGSAYGAIRFYSGGSNIQTIHAFSAAWDDDTLGKSAGAINIDGNTGVTIGGWNAPQLVVRKSDGNVGIGTSTPSQKLDINGYVSMTAPGIDNGNWNPLCVVKTGTGVVYLGPNNGGCYSSSIRYKENIFNLTSVVNVSNLYNLRGITFNYKNETLKEDAIKNNLTNTQQIGIIAEEANEYFPQLVSRNEKGEINAFSYEQFTAVLLEGMKMQKKEIDSLTLQVSDLNENLTALNEDVNALKKALCETNSELELCK